MDKNKAKEAAAVLVDRFGEQIDSYKSGHYNEAQTRLDFINPLFKALGWDVDNQAGYAEAYREVIYEDKIKIAGATKAPDYSFRLPGGKRLFFVEAKKPSVSVKDEIQPAYQVRRYGWSAKLPISIITDFEEFAVYDCTTKPSPSDKAANARINYLTFTDYIPEFDFLWDTFSKESVLKGSFDKFVVGESKKRGTSTVDKEFLTSLDNWRTVLAVNIAKNNPALNEFELNFAVQQTLDRIIFLRIAEDRRVEPYGTLQSAVKSGELYYKNFFALFRRADEKYNSGLFDFKLDKLSDKLVIENKTLKSIINELYYPVSPYEFSVLSVEILGSAYEQFLGKTIRISGSHRAKIEEKPEVRKAGGVYYTPQYIVDYIVKNTVGKLIEGKTPAEIEKIKIVDPACGSGSFLLGAYDYLLSYHREYYNDNPAAGSKKDNPLTPEGFLTSAVKKRILINNIFGVDIDANAVEVTKLSLLLKCLEGETEASISTQLSLWNDRVLPTLDDNIKSGNSLIDTDFYDQQLDFGEIHKIKPFNWQKSFPSVFAQGGFDAVIGNPPYLRIQGLQETQSISVNYFKKKFVSAASGNFDLYVIFDERGYHLLNDEGILGFIQPHKFFQADFGANLRGLLSKEKAICEVVNFGSQQIFKDASTYSCLLFLSRKKQSNIRVKVVNDLEKFSIGGKYAEVFTCDHPRMQEKWNFVSQSKGRLLKKLFSQKFKLEDITRKIFVGLQTSADKIYVLEKMEETPGTFKAFSKELNEVIEVEKELVKQFIMGKDVKRYEPLVPKNLVIFPYLIQGSSAILMNQKYIKTNFPLGWEYLSKNRKELEAREKGKMKGENFYGYIYPKNLAEFERIKICTPEIAIKPQLTLDRTGNIYHTTKVYSFIFNNTKEDVKYFLAVLNSPVMWYFLTSTGYVLRGGYYTFKTEYLKPFPIKLIDTNSELEVNSHNEIVALTEKILILKEELLASKLASVTSQLISNIDYMEDQINNLIYLLYDLTPEEIKLIESRE